MVKLLLVSPQSKQSQGGMVVWTDTFLSQCSKSDISCDLLNIATIGARAKQGNNKRNFSDEFIRTKAIFKNLKKMVSAEKYDVAHINTSCGAFGLIRDYLITKKIKKSQPSCKTIIHFHCNVEKYAGSGYKKIFLKKILKVSDEALVLNADNKKFLKHAFSVDSVAIPNFIHESFVRNYEKKISDSIKNALFVGYVQPEKGVREIYDLAERFPKITFNLIGEVRADVKQWNKPENIVFLGKKNREEIVEALDNADVFIFPTHSEGFSIALLECMSRGVPCITTAVGANAEMIEDKGGVVVTVGDVDAMAEALDSIQEPIMRRNMSDWNIEKVRSCYTVETVFDELKNLYK